MSQICTENFLFSHFFYLCCRPKYIETIMRVTLSFPWWTSTWAKEERAALLAPLNYTVIVVAARVEEDVGVRVAGTSLNLT